MGPLRRAEGGNGFLGPQGCHLSENIMRKVAFENGHFFHCRQDPERGMHPK